MTNIRSDQFWFIHPSTINLTRGKTNPDIPSVNLDGEQEIKALQGNGISAIEVSLNVLSARMMDAKKPSGIGRRRAAWIVQIGQCSYDTTRASSCKRGSTACRLGQTESEKNLEDQCHLLRGVAQFSEGR